jgi:vitamin B12 transporter
VSGGGDRGDFFLSFTDFATDGFNAQSADTLLRDEDGAGNTTLHAKLGWNASDALRVQLVARDIEAATDYDGCFDPATFATVHDCTSTTEQTTYRLSADFAGERLSHAFGYSNVAIVRDDFAGAAAAFATDGELGRLEYTGTFKRSEALALVYGLELQDERVVAANDVLRRDQRGYYAEYQGAFAGALFVSLGARYDDNDDFGSHTSARASAAYVQALGAGRSLKYRASVGTGFRAPSLAEIAYNSGPFAFPPAAGVALAEERSRGFDLGLEYAAASGARYEIAYFDQEIEDEIYFDLIGFSGYLQSPGTSSSQGVELAADLPLGARWRVLANFTHNDAESSSNERRLRRPKNLGNVGALYRAASSRFELLANYRVSHDSIDVGGVALDDYEVLDLSASYDVNAALEIYGRIQNATDASYQEVLGHNTAGRSIYAGARWRF